RPPPAGFVRAPDRLFGDLLHLHVVQIDLDRSVHRLRARRPSRSGDGAALSRAGAGAGFVEARGEPGVRFPRPATQPRRLPRTADADELRQYWQPSATNPDANRTKRTAGHNRRAFL